MGKKKDGGNYDVMVRCSNCGMREVWVMVWGELVVDVIDAEVCPGCGCVRELAGWKVMSEVMV